MQADIRPSPIAGQWYSGNPRILREQIISYLENCHLPEIHGSIVAVISPHAGYIYSGGIAAHAFAAIRDLRPDTVAIISPMHHPYRSRFLTTAHSYYATPLGNIPVDKQLVDQLRSSMRSRYSLDLDEVSNDPEHSLEIEIPFLQVIYQHNFTLLPVMVRDIDEKNCTSLGEALFEVLAGRNAVVVASTDLSHFYRQSVANALDETILSKMTSLDIPGIEQSEITGTGFACGAGAVMAAIAYAKFAGAREGVLLAYGTSGDITGDRSSVVGYGAVAILKE